MDELLALSTRQPWASLIVLGLKDIEIRTWITKHRGRLLIHAGTTISIRPMKFWFPKRNVPTGAIIGSVKLIDVVRFTRKTWKEWGDRHLDIGRLPLENTYAWILEDPRPFLEPIPYRGLLKLFRVSSLAVHRALTASLTQR
ncbi:MAG TPA: ASCH domain-containing protein [Patescibacteria group bacterium]|nr:ASCH domain-containing protein [Patescibacteria group bacterium]